MSLVEERKIFKYELVLKDKQEIQIPKHATILKVAMQNGSLCVWCSVTPSRKNVPITFYIVGTGNPMPLVPLNYLDSVFDDVYVWHIFTGIEQ